MTNTTPTLPTGTRWIMSRSDLPTAREPARYEWTEDGKPHFAVLSKRNRQVLDALRRGPLYCASPVRLSDSVLILKRDYGIDIETLLFSGDGESRFGVYRLASDITFIGQNAIEAEAA